LEFYDSSVKTGKRNNGWLRIIHKEKGKAMFKRFTNQQLIIVLSALAVIYLASMAFGGRADRTFNKTVSALDTAKVSQILITPAGGEPVKLLKEGPQWNVELPGGGTAPTGKDMVQRALESIAFLEATQLVSKNERDWAEYKVDTSGTKVEVMAGGEKALELIIGRFEYKQTGMMSYVRTGGNEETYMVEGFLETSFNREADDWRNKTIIPGTSAQWTGILFNYAADSAFQLLKGAGNQWMFSDSSAINASEASSFVTQLANTNGTEFIDSAPNLTSPTYQMMIQSNTSPVEIKAYQDVIHNYIITSSANPGTWFADRDGSIVEKIFVSKNKFLPTE
jgi:hypothetical protein